MEAVIGLLIILAGLAIWILGSIKVFKRLGKVVGFLFAIVLPGLAVTFSVLADGKPILFVGLFLIVWVYILAKALRKDRRARKLSIGATPFNLKLCPSCHAFQDAEKKDCPNCGHDLTSVEIFLKKKS